MKQLYAFFLFLIIAIPSSSSGQDTIPPIPFFNNYDFESGVYQLLLFDTEKYIDSPKYSYSKDIAYIQQVQKTLTGSFPISVYPFSCNETKTLHLCKGDSIIESVFFSANCRHATTPNGILSHSGLFSFQMKPLRLQEHAFPTAEQANKHIQKIHKDPNLVFISTENWMQYEGQFGLFYQHKDYQNELVKKEILKQLEGQFPKQYFEIYVNRYSGMSDDLYNYHITIYCQKKLFNKCTIGAIDNKKWQPFPITFNSYWK